MARDTPALSTSSAGYPVRASPAAMHKPATSVPTTTSPRAAYRHDPYRIDAAPEGTLHAPLWGRVSFVPYPKTSFRAPVPPPPLQDDRLKKVFIGQLPYFITEMQLSWLCFMFSGLILARPEPIKKRRPDTGELHPTGCVYGYATAHGFDTLVEGMHKRTLIDDTGVWHAQSPSEFAVLSDYVNAMKADRSLRPHHRPYDTVVVQLANVEQEHQHHHHQQQQQQRQASPPPPSYESSLSQMNPPPYFGESQRSYHSTSAASPIVPLP